MSHAPVSSLYIVGGSLAYQSNKKSCVPFSPDVKSKVQRLGII